MWQAELIASHVDAKNTPKCFRFLELAGNSEGILSKALPMFNLLGVESVAIKLIPIEDA